MSNKLFTRTTARLVLLAIAFLPCMVIASTGQISIEGKNAEVNKPKEMVETNTLIKGLEEMQDQLNRQGEKVSLEEAIAMGLANNPQLEAAFATIQQYEWQLISAQRQWYPTFQLTNGSPFIGYTWQTFVQTQYGSGSIIQPVNQGNINILQSQGSSSSISSGYWNVQPGATISWNIIDPTRKPDIKAASKSLMQQKLLFDSSARNVVYEIQNLYFQIQSTQKLIESFSEIYRINKRQVQIIEAQRKIGMATVLDLEQQQSQLYIQLSQLIQYTQAYIKQTAQLARAIGLRNGQLILPATKANQIGSWQLGLEETIKQAIMKREEILADLAAAEAARWTGIAAIRSYLPIFQLVGTGSLMGQNGYIGAPSGSNSSTFNMNNNFWTGAVGLGFNWTFYDGGIQASNAQAAFALSRQSKAQAITTQLEVEEEIRSSYGQYITSEIAIKSAQQAVKSAQKAQKAAEARFNVGIGDITTLVQAIQQLSQASQQLSAAILAYNSSVAQLYRYSSTWPQGTEEMLNQTINKMRNPGN